MKSETSKADQKFLKKSKRKYVNKYLPYELY